MPHAKCRLNLPEPTPSKYDINKIGSSICLLNCACDVHPVIIHANFT